MTGVEGVEDVVEGAGAVVVGAVGVSSWVSPGMSLDSFCIPRPLVELPPLMEEPAAATPDSDEGLDDEEGVGLESAPANGTDGVVVVVDVLAGATPFDEVVFTAVESLL